MRQAIHKSRRGAAVGTAMMAGRSGATFLDRSCIDIARDSLLP
jgi:hypothetical protein